MMDTDSKRAKRLATALVCHPCRVSFSALVIAHTCHTVALSVNKLIDDDLISRYQ